MLAAAAALSAGCQRYYIVSESGYAVAVATAKEDPHRTVAVAAVRERGGAHVFAKIDSLELDHPPRASFYNFCLPGSALFFGVGGVFAIAAVAVAIDGIGCREFACDFSNKFTASILGGVSGVFVAAGIPFLIVGLSHPGEVKAGKRGVVYIGADGAIHW